MANVSVRAICNELKISPGNFNYHFPNKDGMVVALYQQMTMEMRQVIENIPKEHFSIVNFLDSHKNIFGVQLRYKFFYLNLFDILTKHPDLKKLHQESSRYELQAARQLFNLYVQGGVIREGISGSEFDRMANVGQLLHNSWAIDAEINFQGNHKKKMIFYLQMCCGLLEPYLRPDAKKDYLAYFEELEKGNISLK